MQVHHSQTLRVLAIFAICLPLLFYSSSLLPVMAQDAEPVPSDFQDRVSQTEILIPVQVIKNGKPVRGLSAANFEVKVDGKRVPLTSFAVNDLAVTSERMAEAAEWEIQNLRRHFLILFDFSHASISTVKRARKAVSSIMDQLHPSDLVGVATYQINRGPQLVLGFTSDRNQIEQALLTLGAPNLLDNSQDPLGLTIVNPFSPTTAPGIVDAPVSIDTEGEPDGNRPAQQLDDLVQQHLEEMFRDFERRQKDVDKNRAYKMIGDLELLAKMLSGIQAPKHVLLLSEGFDDSIFFADQDTENIQRMNRASASGQIWEVDSDERFGDNTSQEALTQLIETFKKSDCRIQAIDISIEEGPNSASGRDTLFAMADGTGGQLVHSTNNLAEAFSEILDQSEVTYELSFTPPKLTGPGDYHKVKVKLINTDRAKLFYKPGFYEPEPYSATAGVTKKLTAASWIFAGQDRGDLDASIFVLPMKGGNTREGYVPVVVDIDGQDLLSGYGGESFAIEMYGYAFNEEGSILDFFQQRANLTLETLGATIKEKGIRFYSEFDLPAGTHSIRLLILDPQTGRHRVLVRNAEIPTDDFVGSPFVVPEGPASSLLLRLDRSQSTGREANPFLFWDQDQPFLPAASARVSAGEILEGMVLLPTENETNEMSVALQDAQGTQFKTLMATATQRAPSQNPQWEWVKLQLELKDIPKGTYFLRMNYPGTESSALQIEVN